MAISLFLNRKNIIMVCLTIIIIIINYPNSQNKLTESIQQERM